MPPITYDLIASAGDWCGPAHNIRRRFAQTRSYPFDWWITPFDATMKLLAEDFQGMAQLENLQIVLANMSVYCNRYGLLHHHDFVRDPETQQIVPELAPQLEKLQQQITRRVNRLKQDVIGRRVLFVRSGLRNMHFEVENNVETVYPADDPKERSLSLYDALANRFAGFYRMDLLVLEPTGSFNISTQSGEILGRAINQSVAGGEFFFDSSYGEIFESLHIQHAGRE